MTAPKILLTRRWPTAVEDLLRNAYSVTPNLEDSALSRTALKQAMLNFDAICPTLSDTLDEELLSTPGSTVRIIANYGAGYDHIDVSAAVRAGIAVTNTPDVLTDATADLAMLLILMTTRRAGEGECEVRSQQWTGWRPTHLLGSSIHGKTLGLVGFGRIAQATAQRAQKAFGMRIVYHGRRSTAASDVGDAVYVAHLDKLVEQCDVLSIHCPGGAETHHLIDARRLSLMKSTAVLINTARGSIVDEVALAVALKEGRIAGAGLDVYENEPFVLPALLAQRNVVLLPHLGSATLESRVAMGTRVAANLESFFAGRPLLDRVG